MPVTPLYLELHDPRIGQFILFALQKYGILSMMVKIFYRIGPCSMASLSLMKINFFDFLCLLRLGAESNLGQIGSKKLFAATMTASKEIGDGC